MSNLFIRNNPTQIKTPKPTYNAIVTGSWSMPRKSGTTNIYVQNNFYDRGHRGWAHDAWANLDNQDTNSGGGFWNKLSEITSYIGLGMAGVGSILDLFGIGAKKNNATPAAQQQGSSAPGSATPSGSTTPSTGTTLSGSATPSGSTTPSDSTTPSTGTTLSSSATPSSSTTSDSTATPSDSTTTSCSASPTNNSTNLGNDANEITPLEDGEEIDDTSGVDWNSEATVSDKGGKVVTRDIKGKMKVGQKTDGKLPKTFTISDSSGTFSFKLVGTDNATGKPVYQCTSGPNGAAYTQGNNYVMQDMKNGKPVFEQPQRYFGSGESLRQSNGL